MSDECCSYCDREMEKTGNGPLRATRDHVVPRSRNKGNPNKLVWACRFCNELKSDMMPDDWRSFMQCYPRWWENPLFASFGKIGRNDERSGRIPTPPPIAVTRQFLREAAMKATTIPKSIPKAFDDPTAQAAFEGTYKGRLHLLREDAIQ